MTKLCARGKAAAKRKFKVYPSAYANAYASKICAGKIKDPSGTKRKDWGPKKAFLGGLMGKNDEKKKETEKTETAVGKAKKILKTKEQRLKELREEIGMKKGGESKKKKMPKARDAAMMDKNIVYLGDPFMVDGKMYDPVKEHPEDYLRPKGAKNYNQGGEVRGGGAAIRGKGFKGVF